MDNSQKKPLFRVRNLKKYFPVGKKSLFNKKQVYVHANEDITIDIYQGETLGLVGESGCGKSTFGRTLIQLYNQTEGSTLYYGSTLAELAPKYALDVINKIPSNFSKYVDAEKKYNEDKAKLANMAEGEERDALTERLMFDHKRIDNEYSNMARIAGGLLVHKDLDKVSSALKDLYNVQVEIGKIKKEIEAIEVDASDEEPNSSKLEKLKAEIVSKGEVLKKKSEEEAELSKRLETLRDECRANEGYDIYEERLDEGVDLSKLTTSEMRQLRKDIQIIFQDPYSSLDTRLTVGQIISEGLLAHGIFKNKNSKGYNEYITQIMEECGLDAYFIHRYPHQFSGGQRQRIGIARALALRPKFIVCDEAVSALDVSIQSQVINLLQDLREKNNLTYLFITHDLSVVKYISDRIGVMYLGSLVELADSDTIFQNPLHPYTNALLQAIPRTDQDSGQELQILEGDIPSAVNPPSGCRFHTRCKYATEKCEKFQPEFKEVEKGHFVACHLMDEKDFKVE